MKMRCPSSSHPQNSVIKVDESLTQLCRSRKLRPLLRKSGVRHYYATIGNSVVTKTWLLGTRKESFGKKNEFRGMEEETSPSRTYMVETLTFIYTRGSSWMLSHKCLLQLTWNWAQLCSMTYSSPPLRATFLQYKIFCFWPFLIVVCIVCEKWSLRSFKIGVARDFYH